MAFRIGIRIALIFRWISGKERLRWLLTQGRDHGAMVRSSTLPLRRLWSLH